MNQKEIDTNTASWKEIEMKFRLEAEQFREVRDLLRNRGTFIKNEMNADYYFQHPVPGYFERKSDGIEDKYLRIRTSRKGAVLCYKQWFFPNGPCEKGYCDEYEVQITDEKKFLKIFDLMGFEASLVIKKHRETYVEGNYEIALDHVEGLGYFMEVEAKHMSPKELNEEFKKILEISRTYGIQDSQHEVLGYVQLAKIHKVRGYNDAKI